MYTDQGLFISFTPGMLTGTIEKYVSSTGGFYIEQRDGSQSEVDFNPSDIIIMLGGGVDHFVNHHLKDGQCSTTSRINPVSGMGVWSSHPLVLSTQSMARPLVNSAAS